MEQETRVFNLTKHPGRLRKRKRVGRGMAAGQGQRCGRGQTGQKSRSGASVHPRFEGGQTPLVRHLPKMDGFASHRPYQIKVFNLSNFAHLAEGAEVNLSYFVENRLVRKLSGIRIKILGEGEVEKRLVFRAHAFSESAKSKIEAAGGICEVVS